MERSLFRLAWKAPVISGVLLLVLAAIILIQPLFVISSVVWILGMVWLVSGFFKLVCLIWDRTLWGWKFTSGFLAVVVGGWIVWPSSPMDAVYEGLAVSSTLGIVLASLGVLVGISTLSAGVALKNRTEIAWGAAEILLALLIAAHITGVIIVATYTYGVFIALVGITSIIVGLRARKAERAIFGREYYKHS